MFQALARRPSRSGFNIPVLLPLATFAPSPIGVSSFTGGKATHVYESCSHSLLHVTFIIHRTWRTGQDLHTSKLQTEFMFL